MTTPLARSAGLAGPIGLAVATVLVAGLLAAGPAVADEQRARDERGDVTALPRDRAGTATLDIVGSRNVYADGRLTLEATVVTLRRQGWRMSWRVRAGGTQYVGTVDVEGERPRVSFVEIGGDRCLRRTGSLDLATDTVALEVPRRCVDDAPAVQVATFSTRLRPRSFLVDDARRGEVTPRSRPRYAPRLPYN